MNCLRYPRLAAIILIPAIAMSAPFSPALAQTPPANQPAATPPATSAPSAPTTAPATSPPTAPETPSATPATPPAASPPTSAQTPATQPAATPKAQNADPFGEEQALTSKKVIAIKGTANWDTAFETLVASLKTLTAFLDKQGIKSTGPSLIVYTSTDDTGFVYQAQIPVEQDPKNLAKDMTIGKSPEGRTLKFVHRGSYDNMDNTYEAITNHLDDKKMEAKDTFIEEYITDPLKTAEDKLIINVFVPLK